MGWSKSRMRKAGDEQNGMGESEGRGAPCNHTYRSRACACFAWPLVGVGRPDLDQQGLDSAQHGHCPVRPAPSSQSASQIWGCRSGRSSQPNQHWNPAAASRLQPKKVQSQPTAASGGPPTAWGNLLAAIIGGLDLPKTPTHQPIYGYLDARAWPGRRLTPPTLT